MKKFIKRNILFLLVALFIAFVLIPCYEIFVGGISFEQKHAEMMANLHFTSVDIWKRVATLFVALWGGKAIIWAISAGPINVEKP